MRARALAMLALLAAPLAPAQELTPQQQRGRAIYTEGKGAGARPILVSVGAARKLLPATLFPCASCHGDDGRGQREGGRRVADITPAALARDAVVDGRARPAYNAAWLRRAVNSGLDGSGQPLDRAMPRYRLTERDSADLLAYLTLLGSIAAPGVSDQAVRVNVVGAPTLEAPRHPIYGRRIVLQHGESGGAFLTIDASADGSASVEAAERERIPTIVLNPGRASLGPHTLVLGAPREAQLAALRDYGAREPAAWLLDGDCGALREGASAALILMTSDTAARCALDAIPLAFDRKIIVAAPVPPGAAAAAQLALVTMTLEGLGRDLTRKGFLAALERGQRVAVPGLPPLTWSASRRYGTGHAWLMTLDLRSRTMLAEPGWWLAPPE